MPRKKKTRQGGEQARQDQPACGLCGNTKGLTKTECCGNWICDDEQEYVLFSFARNSCYRNHRRQTLCGFHHEQGHQGRWQDCVACREAFNTELYVYYGTSEYNFETLADPPAYEPTRCHQCGRVIVLGEGGYSIAGGDYFCHRCSAERLGGRLLAEDDGQSEFVEASAPPPGISHQSNEDVPDFLDLAQLQRLVHEDYCDRFDAIVERTDTFCDRHLNDEYKQLAREMAVAICQEGSPVLKGKPESWAAGTIYALGQVNFLTDPSQDPHMKTDDIAAGIGVSPSTMQAKARVIREGLDLMELDPEWSLPSLMDENPLVWMFEVNGMVVDMRLAPRELQVSAYEQGLIPYIPADQNES